MSAADNKKGHKQKSGYKLKRTPIAQYDMDGNLIAVYANQTEAARQTGICRTMINRVINHDLGRNSTHGYIFKRVEA